MIVNDDKNFVCYKSDSCDNCNHYSKDVLQIMNPFCVTCSRLKVIQVDRFESHSAVDFKAT